MGGHAVRHPRTLSQMSSKGAVRWAHTLHYVPNLPLFTMGHWRLHLESPPPHRPRILILALSLSRAGLDKGEGGGTLSLGFDVHNVPKTVRSGAVAVFQCKQCTHCKGQRICSKLYIHVLHSSVQQYAIIPTPAFHNRLHSNTERQQRGNNGGTGNIGGRMGVLHCSLLTLG